MNQVFTPVNEITPFRDDGYLKWTVATELSAGITCMDFFDLTSDGNKELVIGFDDGTIHVYAFDRDSYQTILPRLIFTCVSYCTVDSPYCSTFNEIRTWTFRTAMRA